jgi:hypothetical protein
MKPISVRTRGAWTVAGGGTALAALQDNSDTTGVVLNPATVGDGFICRMAASGYPVAGDLTLTVRGRRVGASMSVEFGVVTGDPGDGGALKTLLKDTVVVPNSITTLTRVWPATKQHQLRDADNVWFGLRVTAAGGTSQLQIATLDLSFSAVDPVGAWNADLSAAPASTLIWLRMGDGRARQGMQINGEWFAPDGVTPIERDRSNLLEDVDGEREASRWVDGWGAV